MTIIALCLALCTVTAPSTFAAVAPMHATEAAAPKLMHVVSFKFKPEATQAQIDAAVASISALKKKVPGVQDYSWGTNVSPEKLNKGFTHVFIFTFASDKDRDAYLVHPDHVAFTKLAGPIIADVFVVDYWTQE